MAYHYRAEQRDVGSLPHVTCVTGNLGIKFIKPTPMGVPLTLRAKVEGEVGRKSRVICEVFAGDVLTAVGDSVFVRVDTEQLRAVAHDSKVEL
jgi:predicted thioesterase